jgi:hypothetical protein
VVVVAGAAARALDGPFTTAYQPPERSARSRFPYDDRHRPTVVTTGGTVARAKKTHRAEARRRYRASTVDVDDGAELGLEEEAGEDEAPVKTPGAAAVAPRPQGGSAQATARPGIGSAFRSSFRPLDLRGDLRALPALLRHRSFLLPVILSGLSIAIVPFAGLSPLAITFWQYFAGAAPLGTAFIAGFLAPRASWLIGGLVCAIAALLQAIAFQGQFGGFFEVASSSNATPITANEVRSLLLSQAVFYGIPSGIFFAAAAAWYKRFLNRANPNRARQAAAQGRRPDGKIPKKQAQRPILARRR